METTSIHITVEVNADLHDAYVADIEASKAGSVRDDKAGFEQMLVDADAGKYDPGQLGQLILVRAGAGWLTCGNGSAESPIVASDWD